MSSAVDLVEQALTAIAAHDERLGAFLSVEPEHARRAAAALDEGPGRAAGSPLRGVPFGLKANLCLEGFEANCGSRVLEGWRPPYTATALARLGEAGAIAVGTTNMDEFGMGSSGENSAYGPTRNPHDLGRTPGGSSSGSAAAVAAGLVPFALGSDTGGSVRQPAALCGLVGFKPTWGRVSRYGLVAFASSLDQIGVLAHDVSTAHGVASAMSGADPLDETSRGAAPIAPLDEERAPDALVLGVPRQFFTDELDTGVRERTRAALDALESSGCTLRPLDLPLLADAVAAYYVVATAEASSNLARFDGVRFGLRRDGDGSLDGMFAATRDAGFGDEVKRRILLGTHVLSSGYHDAWYGRAMRVRAALTSALEAAFEDVDLLVGPTYPTTAFELGARVDDPVAMYLPDVLTVPANLAGLPAISVPCGSGGEPALPVGLQLLGPRGADERVLAVARRVEDLLGTGPRAGGAPS